MMILVYDRGTTEENKRDRQDGHYFRRSFERAIEANPDIIRYRQYKYILLLSDIPDISDIFSFQTIRYNSTCLL